MKALYLTIILNCFYILSDSHEAFISWKPIKQSQTCSYKEKNCGMVTNMAAVNNIFIFFFVDLNLITLFFIWG